MLVVGRDGDDLLGLQLTSKDHDRDAEDEARYGRYWMDVGTGAWDRAQRRQRGAARPAAAAARRRRYVARVPRWTAATFDAVVAAAREHHAL